MSQAKKTYGLNTEYAGFEGGEVLLPKCFEFLKDQRIKDIETAVLGITQLWAMYSNKRTDAIVVTDLHKIRKGTPDPLVHLLFEHWLGQNLQIIDQHLKPTFSRVTKRSMCITGTPNFPKSLISNFGLAGPIESSKSVLNFATPPLMVIRDAIEILSGLYTGRRISLLDKRINGILYRTGIAVASIPLSRDPVGNAHNVLAKKYTAPDGSAYFHGLPRKLVALAPVIDFSIDVVLSAGQSVNSAKTGVPGIKLNLNYLIQYALEEALTLNGGYKDLKIFPNEKINNVKYLNPSLDIEYKKWMSPDCYGVINSSDKKIGYILDSKHKAFFKNGGDIPTVNRDDFYQLLSYASTHCNQSTKLDVDWFYGLVGLAREESILVGSAEGQIKYIDGDSIGIFEVQYNIEGVGNIVKSIYTIPLRFSQLLFDCGSAKSVEEIKNVLKQLGSEILRIHSGK